jgi:hypothetical protein
VRVPHDEGVANHIDPESCAGLREDVGEALTGESIGQPLSRDRGLSRVSTMYKSRKTTCTGAISASARPTRRGLRPWHVQTLLVREPGDLTRRPLGTAAGPHREGEEP